MVVYRTAFKTGDEWLLTGLEYKTPEDAHRRAEQSRKSHPTREVIVVTMEGTATDNPTE